jgi:hypothetical protein
MRLFEVEGAGVDRDIDVIFQVLDSVVPDGEGSYLASPISTGKRFFHALAEYEVTDFPSLIEKMGEAKYLQMVRWPNVKDGEEVANRLRTSGVAYLINTGPIFIKEWNPRDYMNLCLRLIERKVRCVYFHPEWAYSAGAVEEFIFCAQRHLTLYTSEGEALSLQDALNTLESVRSFLLKVHSSSAALVETQIAEIGKLLDSKDEVEAATTHSISLAAE